MVFQLHESTLEGIPSSAQVVITGRVLDRSQGTPSNGAVDAWAAQVGATEEQMEWGAAVAFSHATHARNCHPTTIKPAIKTSPSNPLPT